MKVFFGCVLPDGSTRVYVHGTDGRRLLREAPTSCLPEGQGFEWRQRGYQCLALACALIYSVTGSDVLVELLASQMADVLLDKDNHGGWVFTEANLLRVLLGMKVHAEVTALLRGKGAAGERYQR